LRLGQGAVGQTSMDMRRPWAQSKRRTCALHMFVIIER
jgi:hypothetical protein